MGQGFSRDVKRVLKLYKRVADESYDVTAMNDLGFMFAWGPRDVPKDVQEAIKWFERAMKRGSETALKSLAVLLREKGEREGGGGGCRACRRFVQTSQ